MPFKSIQAPLLALPLAFAVHHTSLLRVDEEIEDSIVVEVPPGHEDFEDPTAAGIEELAEPEFSGLSLEDRKIAVQAWFASRQKVEGPTRGKSSHVRFLYTSTPFC